MLRDRRRRSTGADRRAARPAAQVGAAQDRDRVLRPAHRAPRRRAVAQAQPTRRVVGDRALLRPEQHEPTQRDVPRALLDEGLGERIAPPQPRELAARAPGLPLGHEGVPHLDGLLLAEGGDRFEHPQAHPVRRQVRAPLEDADVCGFRARGGQQPDAGAGGAVGVARPPGGRAPRHQPALPVQLLLTLEPVERLQHAEVGGGHHRFGF